MADYPFFKILASKGHSHGLDLSNASTNNGTSVTIWQYQDNTLPVHRQWMLFPLQTPQQDTGITETPQTADHRSSYIYDLAGRRHERSTAGKKGFYIMRGKKYIVKEQ